MKKTDVAIFGGSELVTLLRDMEQFHIGTPYSIPLPISVRDVGGMSIALVPRHNIYQ